MRFRTTTLTAAEKEIVLFDNNTMTVEGFCNFVGHNDKVDYARVNVLSGTAEVQFTVESTGDATFVVYQLTGSKLKKLNTVKVTAGSDNTTKLLGLAAGDEYFLSMTAKDTKKGSVYNNVSADVSSLKDAPADALAMPETDCLAVSDARSFGLRETDALADVSAGFPAGLDDKFGWRDLMLA